MSLSVPGAAQFPAPAIIRTQGERSAAMGTAGADDPGRFTRRRQQEGTLIAAPDFTLAGQQAHEVPAGGRIDLGRRHAGAVLRAPCGR